MVAAVAEVMKREQRLDVLICTGMGIGGSVENTLPVDFERQFGQCLRRGQPDQAAVPFERAAADEFWRYPR